MPYVIRKKGSQWCVYKKSGGRSLGCHDSKAKAERQRRAINANEASATEDTVTTMDTNGNYFFYPSFSNNTTLGNFTWTFDPEQAEEEERGGSFEGVLAVIGHPTSDMRYLIPGEVDSRDKPLPFMVQTATEQGHLGAECCGRIESITHIPISDFDRADEFNLSGVTEGAVVVWAEGTFDVSEFADEAERMIENGAGVSIDMPPERIAMFDPETLEEIPEEEVDWEAAMMGAYLVGIAGKIAAATIVSIPAFEEASIVLVPGHALVASAYGIKLSNREVLTASAAGQAPLKPPKAWFYMEEPTHPVPLTVTPEGQVYGHLALWDQCHAAYASCERAPASRSDYAYFHVGEIETKEGEMVEIGRITVGEEGNARGGHASVVLGRRGAMEHYEQTGCVAAFVRASNGILGIWLSGAVRSDVSVERIRDLRANPPSGDWRDDELVAVLSVPCGGFAIPRMQALVASAANGEEEVKTLIASGYSNEEEAVVLDIATYRRKLRALAERRSTLA